MLNLNNSLLEACKIGLDLDKIKTLLAQGADINSRDKVGRAPLHLAVENQNPASKDLILLLFQSGANYKAKDVEGKLACEMSTYSSGNASSRTNMAFLRGLVDQAEWEKEQRQIKLIENFTSIVNQQAEQIVKMQQQIDYIISQQQKQYEQSSQVYNPSIFKQM